MVSCAAALWHTFHAATTYQIQTPTLHLDRSIHKDIVLEIELCCLLRSAILAHLMLSERLNTFGVLGCTLCIVGSLVIVLHAPPERQVSSGIEIWMMAMRPGACDEALKSKPLS